MYHHIRIEERKWTNTITNVTRSHFIVETNGKVFLFATYDKAMDRANNEVSKLKDKTIVWNNIVTQEFLYIYPDGTVLAARED